jgi:hypothetical protein
MDDHPARPGQPAAEAFTTFAVLWGVATLVHLFSFPSTRPVNLVLTVTAILFLLRPASHALFAAVLGLDVLKVAVLAPFVPNHILFTAFVNLTVLAALARTRRRAGGPPGRAAAAYDLFAPAVRLEVLVLYVFAVLHKLNADYFNPDVSCGAKLASEMAARLSSHPLPGWVRVAAIWGSLAIEGAIPLLLWFRATRPVGFVLGLGFHFTLAFHPHLGIYSFSAMLLALYCLFVPAEVLAAVNGLWRRTVVYRWSQHRWWLAAATLAAAALLALAWLVLQGSLPRDVLMQVLETAGLGLWLLTFTCFATLLVLAVRARGWGGTSADSFRPTWAPLLVLPALAFFNGFAPYLGLKTTTAYSMFSNLRTEGDRPNHLFLPRALRLAHYQDQDNLAEVVRSSDGRLQSYADQHLLLPYFEFRRLTSTTEGDFTVTYRRAGRTATLDTRRDPDSELRAPVPWLLGKVLVFRGIDRDGPQQCRH